MNRTKIEWAKNPDGTPGYTWNPITGCLNHVNGMGKGGNFPCCAYRLATTRLRERYLANQTIGTNDFRGISEKLSDPFSIRFWPERLKELEWLNIALIEQGEVRKPRGIFVYDMADLFGIGVPEEWTEAVLNEIDNKYDRFYLLTKQPQNLAKFSPFPDNCWVGQTITNQADANRTFNDFAKVEAAIKYVSLEPLLGRVDITPYLKGWVNAGTIFENPEGVERYDVDGALVNHIDWLIIGALTSRSLKDIISLPFLKAEDEPRIMQYGKLWTLQPKIEWVREIVEAADKAGVRVFLKNNLRTLIQGTPLGQCTGMWAKGFKLRQEAP